jgi:predicted AAA+ superfamily ATPase
VIGRDIPLIRRVEHPALFRQTLSLACQHPAHILSLQKMVGQLQERGSINTVADYLDLLASAFLVEPIQKWSPRPLRTRSSIPKIIVRNSALVNALRPATPEEALADTEFRGHLVENAIGASLLNEEKELFYWNDRKYELDFVVREGERLLAIEVKSGRKRSAPGLGLFLKRVPQAKGLIIGGEGADLSLEDFFRHGITI